MHIKMPVRIVIVAEVVRWCDGAGEIPVWIRVGQGPTALAVDAGGSCLDIFLSSIISLFFLST